MSVQTAAGSKIFIGPVNSTANSAAEYEALAYTLIGEVTDVGEFGDTFRTTSHTAISDRRERLFKTSKSAGTLALQLGRDPDDAGQAALKAARDSDSNYAFMIQQNDPGVSGSPANPTTHFFRALVLGFTTSIGNSENVIGASCQVAINSDVVEVPAVTD